MGKLRDQMLVDLQLSGAKPRTQKTYLREAENLAKYFNKIPGAIGRRRTQRVSALPDEGKASVRGNISVLCGWS